MSRWFKRVTGGALVVAGAFVAWRAARAARAEMASFYPRRGPVARPQVLAELAQLRDVAFVSAGQTIRGWFIPSRNGAAVVLAHGSSGDRSHVAKEGRALANAGFGALMFDWPGHGESDGRVTYGTRERDALREAVGFVASQPGVDAGRIGALGISVGAPLIALEASGDLRVRAIVMVSPFCDSVEQTRAEYARWGQVAQWPALWVDRIFMSDGPLRIADSLRALGGRSLLVVAGEGDPTVPLSMSKEVYDTADAKKELLVLPTNAHADFDALAPGPYGERIVHFFQSALAEVVSPSGAL
jgi:uncharacterized protein